MHSFPPTKIYAIAPKKNIREFPIKNATTVAIVPDFASLANLAKFGVAVPPIVKMMILRSFVPWSL